MALMTLADEVQRMDELLEESEARLIQMRTDHVQRLTIREVDKTCQWHIAIVEKELGF